MVHFNCIVCKSNLNEVLQKTRQACKHSGQGVSTERRASPPPELGKNSPCIRHREKVRPVPVEKGEASGYQLRRGLQSHGRESGFHFERTEKPQEGPK